MLPEITIVSTIVYCSWFPGNGKGKGDGGLSTRKSQDTSVTRHSPALGTDSSSEYPKGARRVAALGGEPYFVNEVQCHSPLPYFHLFGFPIFSVLISDFIYALLQPPSRLILLPVLLTLRELKYSQHQKACREPAPICFPSRYKHEEQTVSLCKNTEISLLKQLSSKLCC